MKTSFSFFLLCLLTRRDSATEAFLVSIRTPLSSVTSSSCPNGGPRQTFDSLAMVASTSSSSSSSSSNYSNKKKDDEEHFLLKKFVTSSGEIINPYNVLQVPRNSDRSDIKLSYKRLAKRYHPDGARNRTILPGKCNNEDEVREEWERIQLAYNILIDNKMRKRYDRSEMIADPGAAIRRAAVGTTLNVVSSIGTGLFSLGQKAVKSLTDTASSGTPSRKEGENPK
ncbi:heat shock protein 40 [Nitzschia inconspicua]|uniref:Heat shock protein 40 n=1 Tax=Nitzschia inconspicua TaxID=303405 RepID=A0A9K3PR13_9STRA|nr:heat shock protein 40 [Nitzschia inconspicua]